MAETPEVKEEIKKEPVKKSARKKAVKKEPEISKEVETTQKAEQSVNKTKQSKIVDAKQNKQKRDYFAPISQERKETLLEELSGLIETNSDATNFYHLLKIHKKGYFQRTIKFGQELISNQGNMAFVALEDETTEKMANDFIKYARNIGYATHPLSQSMMYRNSEDILEFVEYMQKRKELVVQLEEFEKETLLLLAKGSEKVRLPKNIGLKIIKIKEQLKKDRTEADKTA